MSDYFRRDVLPHRFRMVSVWFRKFPEVFVVVSSSVGEKLSGDEIWKGALIVL